MSRIVEAVRQLAPACHKIYLDGLLVTNFQRYGIDDSMPLRQSHFIGQFLGETGGGTVLQESGAYKTVDRLMTIFGVGRHTAAITQDEAIKIVALPMPDREKVLFERVYASGNPRKMQELGNRPGDGWPFRGTGVLQSTGRGHAKKWADRLGVAMRDDQQWMLDPKIVFQPALFEWDAGKCNALADVDDVRRIRRYINGGYNGLADVEKWQDQAYKILRDPTKHPAEPWQAAKISQPTLELQQALNSLGCTPKLAEDGRMGPATKSAVRWFQTMHGLNADGIPGPVTVGKLANTLKTTRAVAAP